MFGLMCGGAVLAACSSNPSGNGSGCGGNYAGAVLIIKASDNLTFSPQNATASLGEAICFQNTGSVLHAIVPDSVNWPADSAWFVSGTKALAPNFPVIVQLGTGDYYYHCLYHGSTQGSNPSKQMWGKISIR